MSARVLHIPRGPTPWGLAGMLMLVLAPSRLWRTAHLTSRHGAHGPGATARSPHVRKRPTARCCVSVIAW